MERPHIPQNRLSTAFSAPHDPHRKMFSLMSRFTQMVRAPGRQHSHLVKIPSIALNLSKISHLASVSLVAIPSGWATPGGCLISTKTAEHYRWGMDCDGWHLLKTGSLSIIQESIPPGRSEVRHFHVVSRQFFFVLAGTLTIELRGHIHILQGQEGLEIHPGEPHRVFNNAAEEVSFLVISQPPSHGDRVLAEENTPPKDGS